MDGAQYRAKDGRTVEVQLGVAHLNHKSWDNRDRNLRALCRRCHLRHDSLFHAARAHRTRGKRKDATRPLLAALSQ